MQALTITAPREVAAIRSQAVELEAFAKGAVQTWIGRRLAYYTALKAVAGSSLTQWLSDGGVLENERATETARNVARSLRALDTRSAVLVPWQSAGDSRIRFAVASRDFGAVSSTLSGLWTVLAVGAGLTLLLLEPGVALIGAGVYLTDAYLAYKTVEANARETLERTQENMSNALLSAQQRGDGATARAIAAAMDRARSAAANANPSWIDSILGTLKTAATGVAGGAGAAILIVLALGLANRGHR